jgi:hypothetical protein
MLDPEKLITLAEQNLSDLVDCKKAEEALESLKIRSHLPNVDINRDHIKQFPF